MTRIRKKEDGDTSDDDGNSKVGSLLKQYHGVISLFIRCLLEIVYRRTQHEII